MGSTHLYKRLCPSVRPSVRWSVRGSVGHAFLKYRGNEDFKTIKHQETHRIAFLVEIQENSRKVSKIQENSAIYWTHRCSNRTCFSIFEDRGTQTGRMERFSVCRSIPL